MLQAAIAGTRPWFAVGVAMGTSREGSVITYPSSELLSLTRSRNLNAPPPISHASLPTARITHLFDNVTSPPRHIACLLLPLCRTKLTVMTSATAHPVDDLAHRGALDARTLPAAALAAERTIVALNAARGPRTVAPKVREVISRLTVPAEEVHRDLSRTRAR